MPLRLRRLVRPLSIFIVSAAILTAILAPFYPGDLGVLSGFAAAVSAFTLTAVWYRPSHFIALVACFLFLGFPLKLIAHLVFGDPLIEPVGDFDGSSRQWDLALGFSTAGFIGCLVAAVVSCRTPILSGRLFETTKPAHLRSTLIVALLLLIAVAAGIYWLNASFHILKIGYPLELDLPFPLYPIISFILTWGALLGGLTLAWWLVQCGDADLTLPLYVAIVLGLGAAITMGSRVQFLLYFAAALFSVMGAPGRNWFQHLFRPKVMLASFLGVLAFGGSLALVTLQRSNDFSPAIATVQPAETEDVPVMEAPPPVMDAEEILPSDDPAEPVTRPTEIEPAPLEQRLPYILDELKNLVIMRWVGLEGPMTLAGVPDERGTELLLYGLSEDPAMGTDGIYQQLAGNPYADVAYFTFLTLPGPIGVAAYSGDFILISAMLFATLLAGHLIELLGSSLLRNPGANAVVGVSLAYLVVQMGFPWTLFVYAVELIGALFVLAAFGRFLKLTVTGRRATA